MSAFDEVRLPSDIDRGAKGGAAWSTTVIVTASGAEQRIAMWSRPRTRWSIGHSLKSVAQMGDLLNFWMARQGRLRGWRLKDWSDFSSKVGGVETKHTMTSLTSTTYQIVKNYTSGGVTVARPIKKPVADTLGNTSATQANSTVRIWNGGAEVTSGWHVDTSTGIVTFTSAPGGDRAATFEFDVPCRFDQDHMQLNLEETTYSSWQGLECVEILT